MFSKEEVYTTCALARGFGRKTKGKYFSAYMWPATGELLEVQEIESEDMGWTLSMGKYEFKFLPDVN